jgi:hypothetical protein
MIISVIMTRNTTVDRMANSAVLKLWNLFFGFCDGASVVLGTNVVVGVVEWMVEE